MRTSRKHKGLGALCAAVALIALLSAAPAQGASDPLFVFTPEPKTEPGKPPPPPEPPPTGYFNGPCGVGVDSFGRFYLADYYHSAIDLFSPPSSPFNSPPTYLGQRANIDPLNGPCALALDAVNNLYANIYHQSVVKFSPAPSFTPGPVFDSEDPTGVAVDTASGRVYVDQRTQIAAYDSAGNPVLASGEPLVVGAGDLKEGYGLALSQFPGTAGRLYVADAGTDEVKVYDPATSLSTPVQAIAGPPGQDFISLREAAIAIDRTSGEVYVADDTQPQHTEAPQALIHVFAPDGDYEGHLKYKVITARPAGLAVDNSPGASQGRVYVTSGNTSPASIYAYSPGAATKSAPLPPLGSPQGEGGSSVSSAPLVADGTPNAGSAEGGQSAQSSVISQKGNLRVKVSGRLAPKRLPREGSAPISVSVGGQITTTDESLPPQLRSLRIELNRHGRLDFAGLPTCPYDRIQPGSSQRALAACRSALVGQGSFTANITLAGQEPYPTQGKLLVFNGIRHGKPVLYGHIYSPRPFATSFVIIFSIEEIHRGVYGTALNAPLPKAMEAWGRLTGLEMTLSRRYRYQGTRHSFISSGCPAPPGFSKVVFPLARTRFDFAGQKALSSTVVDGCRVG